MNFRLLITATLASVAGVNALHSSHAATVTTPDGLVAVHSRNLDELYLRPGANLAAYRKVVIDPVRVGFTRTG
jgi:hypothetical protein